MNPGEQNHGSHSWHWLEVLAQDIRYSLRTLRKNPRFAMVAILTLGLGIGATTAVFSLFDTIYMGPLPFRNPDRIVRLRDSTLAPDGRRIAFDNTSRTAVGIRDNSQLFSGIAALDVQDMNLIGAQDTQRVQFPAGRRDGCK